MRVDFAASMGHFMDHLVPVADECLRRWALGAFPPMHALGSNFDRPVVTSAWCDAIAAYKAGRRKVVLMEHGAGQSYSSRHRSYPGGQERTKLSLVLAPNEQAAERHRRYYPQRPPVVVVGSPRVDRLAARPTKPCDYPPIVAVSWHWDCKVAREAGTAWSHNNEPLTGPAIVDELVRMRDLGVIQLLGHAHPRIAEQVHPHYAERGIHIAESFEGVCDEADVFMVDNSSTLFEFASLDRPVIVVNSPRYRPQSRHGLRFWDCADVGVHVNNPADVPRAVMVALEDPIEQAERRREVVETVYPHRFEAASRAVDAIEAVFGP